MRSGIALIAIVLSALGAAISVWAADGASRSPASERSKSIDFDNDVIEGMNKNPLDSLTRVGASDDKQQGHLYRRKANFKRETRQASQEMGYSQ
jgi:hypothetical protein